MRFDPSGLKRAFDRMEKSSKSRGKKLSGDQGRFFVAVCRRLGWKLAPSKEELQALVQRLGNRVKRPKGKTVQQEIARRIRMRGAYARSWMIDRVEHSGFIIRVWIHNRTNYSGILEQEKHVAEQAANIVGGRFQSRLQRYAKQVTDSFKR